MKFLDHMPALTQDQIALVHSKSMELLETSGMWICSEKARELFKKNGFRVDGEIVYYTEKQVLDALKTCPSEFLIRALNSKEDLLINKDNVWFNPNGTVPFVSHVDGTITQSTEKDAYEFFKLQQMLPEINIVAEIVDGSADVNAKNCRMHMGLLAAKLLDKVFFLSTKEQLELLAIRWGMTKQQMLEECKKGVSYGLANMNPRSPLTVEKSMGEWVMEAAGYGIPMIITPMDMAGLTAPCTLPGVIIQMNAEVLGTMVLSQLVNPGAPVFYGVISTVADMRTLVPPSSAPEAEIISRAGIQMADFYGLPTRTDACCSDSCTTDFQAGAESGFSMANALRNGGNIIKGAGSLTSRNIASLCKLVLDADVIRYGKRIIRPLEFNDDTMAMDVIRDVAPHGSFIDEDHTFDHYQDEFCVPEVFQILSAQSWQQKGSKDVKVIAEQKARQLIDSYVQPDLDPEIEKQLDKYYQEHLA